jgi:ABC-type Fe3+ transport system permease subunit
MFFAVVVSAAVLIISLFAIYNMETIKKRVWFYDINLFLPLVISPIVLALAIFLGYRIYINVGSVVWPLIIFAQTVIAIPLTLRILTSSVAHVQPEFRDSALLLGASKLSAFFKVELPLIRKGVITAFSFSFAISIGEFAATNFLYIPKYTTLAISIYNLLNLREFVLASAAASLLILLSFIYFFIIQFYGEHTEYE